MRALRIAGKILRILLILVLILSIYLTPTGIAMLRRKRNTPAIFTYNFLLGWIFIGWALGITWALMKD